nr:alkaline phosphatase D family protein [Deltaproteobacteria bacterium]
TQPALHNAIKAANVTRAVLFYTDLLYAADGGGDQTVFTAAECRTNSWLALEAGAEIINPWGGTAKMVNLGASGAKEAALTRIRAKFTAALAAGSSQNFDGVFLDDANMYFDALGGGAPDGYTDYLAWRDNALRPCLAHIAAGLHADGRTYVVPNFGDWISIPQYDPLAADVGDGFNELATNGFNRTAWSDTQIGNLYTSTRAAAAAGRRIVLVTQRTSSTDAVTPLYGWCLANIIGEPGSTYHAIADQVTAYGSAIEIAAHSYNLGAALQGPQISGRLYSRQFTNYTLYANTGSAAVTLPDSSSLGALAGIAQAPLPSADPAVPVDPATTIYYVSPNGNDTNDGRSIATPWKTVARVNTQTLVPADVVYFERGGVWSGTILDITESGTDALGWIIIGAYGTGERPQLLGGTSDTARGTQYIQPIEIHGSQVLVENVWARRSWYAGIDVFGDNVEVRFCKVSNCPVGIEQDPGAFVTNIHDNDIVDNNIPIIGPGVDDDAGSMGVLLHGDRANVHHNYIARSVGLTTDYGYDGTAVEIYGATNFDVHHNYSTENKAFTEIGNLASIGGRFHHNVIYEPTQTGFAAFNIQGDVWGAPYDHTFEHNTVYAPAGSSNQGLVNSDVTKWTASTALALNKRIVPPVTSGNNQVYGVTVAGTTGTSAPSWPTTGSATFTSGTVTLVRLGQHVTSRNNVFRVSWKTGYTGQPINENNNLYYGHSFQQITSINAGSGGPTAYRDAVLADSPTAYLMLQETTGTTAVDQTGNHAGTYVNAPTLAIAGPVAGGKGVTFAAASSQYVNWTTLGTLGANLKTSSWEFWVKTTTTATANILGTLNTGTTTAVEINTNQNENSTLVAGKTRGFFRGTSGSYNRAALTGGIYDGAWHHVVLVYETGTTFTLYVDGVAQTLAYGGQQNPATFANFEFPLTLAARNLRGVIDAYSSLSLAHVAVYPTRLTSARVLAHFNATSATAGGSGVGPQSLLTSAPVFVSTTTPNLALAAGSPGIDAGANTGSYTEDYLGNARVIGAAVDMGAYELQTASTGGSSGVTPGAPVALTYMLSGGSVAGGFKVTAVGDVQNATLRAVASLDPTLATGRTFGSSVTLNGGTAGETTLDGKGNGWAGTSTLSGLLADTNYYYGVELNGTVKANISRCRTAPTAGTAKSFTFAQGSCNGFQNWADAKYLNLKALAPDFLIQDGDFHYADGDVDPGWEAAIDTVSKAREAWRRQVLHGEGSIRGFYQMLSEFALVYVPDDHEGDDNYYGSYVSPNGRQVAPVLQQIWRERFPTHDLPATTYMGSAFTWGRVRFIVSDIRSTRTAPAATDNSSKTMLGTAQKTWFKAQLDQAAADVTAGT